MKLETELNIILTELLRPIVTQCFQEAIQKINTSPVTTSATAPHGDFTWLKGFCVGIPENTLRQWDAAGKIPGSSKIGKRRIYNKAKVSAWVESLEQKPIDSAKVDRNAEEQVDLQLLRKKGVSI